LPFHYYFKDYDISVETQGYPGDEVLLYTEPKQVEDLTKLFEGLPYVWLIVRDIEAADPNWTVKEWLDTHGYVRQKDLVSDVYCSPITAGIKPQQAAPSHSVIESTQTFFL
jgi:hypothetical protein